MDAEGRWFANDELVRIDLDEAVQHYEESKLLYTQGKMTAEDWDTCQIKHLNGIAALRESLRNLQKERTALHKALNQNFDLTPQPSRNFVTLLLEFLEGQETRSSKLRSQFRKELIDVHGGYDEGCCPIVGGFLDPERVKAAHIYPYVLGTTVMRMIIGNAGFPKVRQRQAEVYLIPD
jgi:hypothetical protein